MAYQLQIRTKLTLQFMGLVATILLLAVFFIYFQYKNQVQKEFYSTLRSKAFLTGATALRRLDSEIQRNPSGFSVGESLDSTQKPSIQSDDNLVIYDENLNIVFNFFESKNRPNSDLIKEILTKGEVCFAIEDRLAIGIVMKSPLDRSYIVIAESKFTDSSLPDLVQILALIFLVLLMVSTFLGWIFAGGALQPVNHMMAQVKKIQPSDLSSRLAVGKQHDELGRLAATFNGLLDRVEQGLAAKKLFISNLSHELRNPLTVIISQIDVLLQKDRTKEEYRQTLVSVMDDATVLAETAEKLLMLSNITSGTVVLDREQLRLDELVWQAKDALKRVNSRHQMTFELGNLPENEQLLTIRANEKLLKSALLNLFENACKYSPDQTAIVKLYFSENKTLILDVSNFGLGFLEEERSMIFEPFFRGKSAVGIRGSGIGLSLAKSICDAHGFSLEYIPASSPKTTFRICF